MLSFFDIYKIGIGPSSSHTVGPMKAGKSFTDDLIKLDLLHQVTKIGVDVYGSLSLTGKGHHTDIAIIMGLAGNSPESVNIDQIPHFIKKISETGKLPIDNGQIVVDFPMNESMIFHSNNLPLHENGMAITAYNGNISLYKKTYYSIGGGAIVDEEQFANKHHQQQELAPYPFHSAKELLEHCHLTGFSISTLMIHNELTMHTQQAIDEHIAAVWQVMENCIERGIHTEGVLPGPLKVPRRAPDLYKQLMAKSQRSVDPMDVLDWVNMFAMAVNEENAAGGRVVTAPTNGACGIIPAVLAYYNRFIDRLTPTIIKRYFLASAAIGFLYKMNASISGAEVGCQGEVGVACSMAAAGLAEIMGASPKQVCMAAEIAMEHNLGLTCDPVAGQVQVPCIERNAIAAVKSINACRMAMNRNSEARVSLDKVIETMYETGKDMNAKYRETSQGGLAIKVLPCE